ncbi:MAG: TetR/AcrR family transcriptional regulator [Actinomycetota bacterium]
MPKERVGPSAETSDAVLTAAFRLLVTEGITAITPTRLFDETGVARTTIYRHWPQPSDVIADILAGATRRSDDDEPTGDLEADLRRGTSTLVFRLANRPVRPLLGALLDADVGGESTLVADYVRGLSASLRDAIEAGVSGGELVDAPVDVLASELVGPLLTRAVLLGMPVTDDDGDRAVDDFLAARRA